MKQRIQTTISILVNTPKILKLVWQTSFVCTIALGVIALLQGILPVIKLWIGKLIVDGVVNAVNSQTPTAHLRDVLLLATLEFSLVLCTNLLVRVNSFVKNVISDLFKIKINTIIFEKSSMLDLAYYEKPSFYDDLQRAQRDAGDRPISVLSSLFSLVQNFIEITSVLALVARFNWIITVVLILSTLPNFIIDLKYSGYKYFLRKVQTPQGRMAGYFSILLTSKTNIKEIKLFRLAHHLIDKWKDVYKQFYRENRDLSRRTAIAGFLTDVLSKFGFYGSYAFVLYKAILKEISIGDLTMYAGAFGRVQSTFKGTMGAISRIYEQNLFMANFFKFLELEPKIKSPKNAKSFPSKISEGIEFKNVSFRYPQGDIVLSNIDLKINPGESIALVGENGAGKTTLIKLLCRLYDPKEGRIIVDGINLKEFDLKDIRDNIGVIFQDFSKYFLTAKENIGFGNVEEMYDINQIIDSAQKSGADKFINKLPHKYETMLGKLFSEGTELSIGEWQKIALARAFMRDAQILILDEPTASLDVKTEYEIFKSFRELTEDKITILISHRFSTVRMADRIFVIEKGKIIEQGSHNELMELNGKYAKMFLMQAESYR